jgi:two-component system NtrC family sensor kinase
MLQRLIRILKQKNIYTPALFVLTVLVVLSVIIILGQFFHQSLQEEMAGQFNSQQLLLAREVAVNIESFVDHVYKNLVVISQLPEVDQINHSPRSRSMAESIIRSLQNEALLTVRVLDKDGILLYDSSSPGGERADFSKADYFQKARLLPKNEKLITDLLDIPHESHETKKVIIATPIYQLRRGHPVAEFRGVVLALLSMDGITQKYLSPIRSGIRGYAWMMDSDGTLLYHPNQPQMVGKNLYRTDKTCFQCHISFDTEKKMIEGTSETFGSYQAPGGENKLAAYYKFPIVRKSWIVVVSAPYSDVIALMSKSRRFYSMLILSIFITTLVVSVVMVVNYKKQIKAEEKAKHLENQRRLEREIEIQKDYLENIIENTKTNLMVIDKDLAVRTLNTAQAQTLGRSKQDFLGKKFFELFPDRLTPHEGIPIEAILHKTLDGSSFEIKDYRLTGLRETPLYLTMNINPLLIDGKTPGILITSTDVTKRVELEDALKQYTVELEDKVDKGTATAKKLEQQVMHSDKLAALGRLSAGIAHEIGNPLTSISSFAQMLSEMSTDEFTQNSLEIINKHIQRITDIVRRMSTFSRADSLNIQYVQLNDILQSTLDLVRLDKRMKTTIDIQVSLAPDLPKTMADEGQMSQVFINIILNALDAMPERGKLIITSRLVRDELGKDLILIEFIDTGIGISTQELEKIFDPFYTTKAVGQGTGLGLSLSYNIIKRYNGDIRVESESGKGTKFTIVLPVEKE